MKLSDVEIGKSYKIQSNAVDDSVPWTAVKCVPGVKYVPGASTDADIKGAVKMRMTGHVRDRPGNHLNLPPERIIELWEDYSKKREVWLKSLEEQQQMNHAVSAHWHTFAEQLGRVFGDGVVAQAYPHMGLYFRTEEAIERMIGILSQQRDKGKPW